MKARFVTGDLIVNIPRLGIRRGPLRRTAFQEVKMHSLLSDMTV